MELAIEDFNEYCLFRRWQVSANHRSVGSDILLVFRRTRLMEDFLVLLCYKRNAQQKGQEGICGMSRRAIRSRRVLMEWGLCRLALAR